MARFLRPVLVLILAVIAVSIGSAHVLSAVTEIEASQVLALSSVSLDSSLTVFTLNFTQPLVGFGAALSASHFSILSSRQGTISTGGATLNLLSSSSGPGVLYSLTLSSALSVSSSGETFALRFQPPGPPSICTPQLSLVLGSPNSVVGNGTAASCTEDALRTAVTAGGLITFNCGYLPVTILLSSHLNVTTKNTTIDGGGLITLEAYQSRILIIDQWTDLPTPLVTLQRLTLQGGKFTGAVRGQRITDDIGGGGAVLAQGGTLHVLDCIFLDNAGVTTQQDAGGGAIYLLGTNYLQWRTGTSVIESSVFINNQCSNGGAIGTLGANMTLNNLIISGNLASGNGGNPGDGGNGGAIVMDGSSNSAEMCGLLMSANQANTYGKATFRVGYSDQYSPPNLHVSMSSSMLYGNYGPAGGFATIYAQDHTFTLTDSLLANNSAPLFGGLWFLDSITSSLQTRSLTVNNVEFHDNLAQADNIIVGALALSSSVTPTSISISNAIVSDSNGYNAISLSADADPGFSFSNLLVAQQASGTSGCSNTAGSCSSVVQVDSSNGPCCASSPPAGDPQLGPLQNNGCKYPTRAIGNSTIASQVSKASCATSGVKFSTSVLMNKGTGAVARPADFYFQFAAGSSTPTEGGCFRSGLIACLPDGASCSQDFQCLSVSCSPSGICGSTGSAAAALRPFSLVVLLVVIASLAALL